MQKTARTKDSLLQKVFEWPANSQGSVILVGIANSLDLIERILPKLRKSIVVNPYILPPEVITFAPYTQKQLCAILEKRFCEAGNDEGMDTKAIALCAKKVSAMTGDVRRAFQIASQTLQSMRLAISSHFRATCLYLFIGFRNGGETCEKENAESPIILRRSLDAGGERKPDGTPQKNASILRRADSCGFNVTPNKHGGINACREILKSIEKVGSPL